MDHVSDIKYIQIRSIINQIWTCKKIEIKKNTFKISTLNKKNFKYSITCTFWYDILKYKNSKMLLTEKFESEIIIS